MMPVEHDMEQMRQLANARRSVRMALPRLPIVGMPEPIQVNIDFDAGVVDRMIERLTVLRAQMKLGLPPAKKMQLAAAHLHEPGGPAVP